MWSNELLIILFMPFVVLLEIGDEHSNVFKTVWRRGEENSDVKKPHTFFMAETLDISGNRNPVSSGVLDNPQMSQNFKRKRRSNYRSQNSRKGFNNCKKNGTEQVVLDKPTIVKSNVIPKLKPPTVLHSYPFQVAVFLDDYNKQHLNYKKTGEHSDNLNKSVLLETDTNYNERIAANFTVNDTKVNNNSTLNLPTHKSDDGQVNNKSKVNNKYDKQINYDVFRKKGESVWVQKLPNTKHDPYKVIPKHIRAETINEKTSKILTILTKTFRKIMMQHQHMKNLHSSLQAIINEFRKEGDDVIAKLKMFDTKYENMAKFEEKINEFDSKLDYKVQDLNEIKQHISQNIEKFEKQQANFFEQQKEFYNAQRVMIAQNEHINSKQESIAKSQNDISKKQNIFAQILRNTNKQYNLPFTKSLKYLLSKQKNRVVTKEINKTDNTRQSPEYPESIKMDLFALPTNKPLENQDNLILQEKDVRHVDDLIFKYYFNNTFIDYMIRNQLFPVIEKRNNNDDDVTKEKRSDSVTLLFPVNKTIDLQPLNRKRRWILRHFNDPKEVKVTRWSTEKPYVLKSTDATTDETVKNKNVSNTNETTQNNNVDPFVRMTQAFCSEIGQNETIQSMKWCIEKALRRLMSIDPRRKFVAVTKSKKSKHIVEVTFPPVVTFPPITTTVSTTTTVKTEPTSKPPLLQSTKPNKPKTKLPHGKHDEKENNINYFPGNDELEMNLQEFELKPDVEGTVFFDRSLHISDLEREEIRSDESDIMPELIPDSNSRIELDPETLNLQSMRRASVRKFNANILNKIRSGKLRTRFEKRH